MANAKLSALTSIAAAPDELDELYIRDVSEAASAESKSILLSDLRLGILEIANLSELAAAADEGDEFFISNSGTIERTSLANLRLGILEIANLSALAVAADETDEIFLSDAGTIKRHTLADLRLGILEIANLTELAAAPASGDEIFLSDAGVIKRLDIDNLHVAFRGTSVDLSADLTTKDYTTVANIAFDAENFDTDAFHDTSTNNDRIVVPSTFNGYYVKVTGNLFISLWTAGEFCNVFIDHYNSSDARIGLPSFAHTDCAADNLVGISLTTGPVLVSTGDYFTLALKIETDTSVTIDSDSGRTNFSLEVLGT